MHAFEICRFQRLQYQLTERNNNLKHYCPDPSFVACQNDSDLLAYSYLNAWGVVINYRTEQEAHRPHRSPEKTVQINKYI